jgi:hypothetical protein
MTKPIAHRWQLKRCAVDRTLVIRPDSPMIADDGHKYKLSTSPTQRPKEKPNMAKGIGETRPIASSHYLSRLVSSMTSMAQKSSICASIDLKTLSYY